MSKVPRLLLDRRRSFSGRSATVLLGSLMGQGLAFLALPLLTRVYSPEVLGRTATVLALVSISAVVVFLQYDQALIVAEESEIPPLLLLNFVILFCVTALVGLVMLAGAILVPADWQQKATELGFTWVLLPLIASYGLYILLTNLQLRMNHVERLSAGRFLYYGGAPIVQISLGVAFGGTDNAFLLGQLITLVVAIVYLVPMSFMVDQMSGKRQRSLNESRTKLKTVLARYQKFPKYQTGAQLINALSVYMPVIFMNAFFSSTWAGWYSVAWRMIAAPVTLLSQAVGQIFYRDSAEKERAGHRLDEFMETTVSALLRISLLPAMALGVVAPTLVNYLLGAEWALVADIVRILLISAIAAFITSPVSLVLNVKERQRQDLLYKFLLFALRAIALILGWLLGSPLMAILGYSLISLIVMLHYLRYILHSVNGSGKKVLLRCAPLLLDTVIIIGVALVLWYFDTMAAPYGQIAVVLLVVIAMWRNFKRGQWRNT